MLVSMNCEDDPSSLMACCLYPPPPHMDQAPPSSNPGGGMGCGGTVYYCPSNQPGCCPHPPPPNNPAVLHHHHHIDYFVYHDYPNCPMTVPMVPTVRPSPPPMPMPVQVPVGHMVQQIVDETGQLRHVILSPQHVAGSPGPPPRVDPNQPPQPPADFFPGFYAPTLMPPPPPLGPPPPSLLHPPGPGAGMVRDERSSRQYQKLKRKLEQKQQQHHYPMQQHSPQQIASTSCASPPASPNRKPPSGMARRSKDRGGSSRGGRESSSSPLSPSDQSAPLSPAPSIVVTVSEIQQCGALLTWAPAEASAASMSGSEDSGVAGSEASGGATPLPCDPPPAMYQVMVGKKGPDGPHKIVYFGPEFSHQLDDLTPGTEYSIKLSVVPVGEAGASATTILATFVTLPAPPAPPPQPKLSSRTKNTLVIKWNSSPNYGMPITQYTVEIAEGGEKERNWRQVYCGKEKQCLISRLTPGQQYILRVSATNQLGTSEFSPDAVFNTTSPPPPAPAAPSAAPLPPATPFSLALCWPPVTSNFGPVNYTLEMVAVRGDDPKLTAEELSKRVIGGYMPVHHGPECIYVCSNLTPATAYLFRLRVQSSEGQYSAWSSPVRLATPPTTPVAPPRPQARGRPQSQALRVRWEQPMNCGGAPIQSFQLQLDDGTGFQDVWNGTGQEALVSGLLPGHSYGVRVCAINSAGQGPFSESLRVSTAPAPPGAPVWTRKQPAPSAHSLTIQWEAPAATGGSTISQYEVELGAGDVEEPRRVCVYRGAEVRCDVTSGLAPATKYALWVRAFNTAGAGPWSSILRLETAVAPPCAPPPPEVVVSRGGCATITWEPLQLASTYNVEMAPIDTAPSAPGTEEQLVYEQVYNGQETKCELKRLLPGATYLVRLQGSNSSGCGAFSPPMRFTTMMSPPGAPPHAPRLSLMESDGEVVSVTLTFDPPCHWGGDTEGPLKYQLEISVAGEHAGGPQLVLCSEPVVEDLTLALDTSYRVRVRAVNSVGPGPLSSTLRLNTPPTPPCAPRLQLAAAMPRALRLSWEPADDQLSVCIEARRGEANDFHVVYEGSELGCKVSRLREDCEYQFRAKATGKGGEGPPGQIHAFRTLPVPKPIPRGLKVIEVSPSSCVLTWQAPKLATHTTTAPVSTDAELHCVLQIRCQRSHDYKKIYRGAELKYTVSDLTPKTEYWLRAAFVAADAPDSEEGQYCPPVTFTTPVPEPVPSPSPAADSTDSSKEAVASTSQLSFSLSKLSISPLVRRFNALRKWWRVTSYKDLSDQQKAFLFIMGFFIASAVLAVLINRFI